MRWLKCSYADMLSFPADYVDVASELSRKEAAEAKARNRHGR